MVLRARRRAFVRRIVVVGALLVVLLAAALLWPRPQRGGLSVPTASASPSGVLEGVLAAERVGDRVCFTISTRRTTAVLRFAVGWSADASLDLLDPSGLVVARPGEEVVLLGAPGAVGTVAGCPTRGRTWSITSVRLRTTP